MWYFKLPSYHHLHGCQNIMSHFTVSSFLLASAYQQNELMGLLVRPSVNCASNFKNLRWNFGRKSQILREKSTKCKDDWVLTLFSVIGICLDMFDFSLGICLDSICIGIGDPSLNKKITENLKIPWKFEETSTRNCRFPNRKNIDFGSFHIPNLLRFKLTSPSPKPIGFMN